MNKKRGSRRGLWSFYSLSSIGLTPSNRGCRLSFSQTLCARKPHAAHKNLLRTLLSALDSKAKWPAFLGDKVLISTYGNANVWAGTVDAAGKLIKMDKLFNASAFTTDVMRATQGADGAFYIARGDGLNFGSSTISRINRIAYKGSCVTVGNLPG